MDNTILDMVQWLGEHLAQAEVSVQVEKTNTPPLDLFARIQSQPYSLNLQGREECFFASIPLVLFKAYGRQIMIQTSMGVKQCEADPLLLLEAINGLFGEPKEGFKHPSWFGFLGYEAFQYIEQEFHGGQSDLYGLPDIYLGLFQEVTHLKKCPQNFQSWDIHHYHFSFGKLQSMTHLFSEEESITHNPATKSTNDPDWHSFNWKRGSSNYQAHSNISKERYLDQVEKVKDHIRAGDIYQANYTQLLRSEFQGDSFHLYQNLFSQNPANFFCFWRLPEAVIMSTSPESFLHYQKGVVEACPIKGTVARDKDETLDRRLKTELLSSEKDLAELSMIVDLFRNDLNRVCRQGSVKVLERASLHSFSNVHHLIAKISGSFTGNSVDLLRACFPSGSITGCPKIRSVEILSELENSKRSVYTGSIGIFRSNYLNLSVAIRTIIQKGNSLYFQVGGGIVYDSIAEKEYEETLLKAQTFLEVLHYDH